MNEVFLMFTITDRSRAKPFLTLYEEFGIHVAYAAAASGTAGGELLESFGLEKTEKVVLLSVVTDDSWKESRRGLERRMKIDVPGTGIAFIVPLSSIGGKRALYYLTDGQTFEKGEESTLKDTKYELLVVIGNQGYSNMIMDAAREQKAGGGTVIHAKGTGVERAEKFLGVSLVKEKEIVLIVVRSENKNRILQSIIEQAGFRTKAQAIAFSLPVTAVAGMRLIDPEEETEAP